MTVLTKSLTAEQERGLILEQHVREVEAERDAKLAEIATLRSQLETARGETVERSALELRTASVENEELRLRIKQVADQIFRQPRKISRNRNRDLQAKQALKFRQAQTSGLG